MLNQTAETSPKSLAQLGTTQRSAIGHCSQSVLDPIAAYFDIPTDFRQADCIVVRNTLMLQKLRLAAP
jgi:hypothetical protein